MGYLYQPFWTLKIRPGRQEGSKTTKSCIWYLQKYPITPKHQLLSLYTNHHHVTHSWANWIICRSFDESRTVYIVHCCIVRLPSRIKQDSHILNTQLPLLGNVSRQPGSHRQSSLGLVTRSALACASGEQSALHWCLLTSFFFSWDTTSTLASF